MISNNKIRTNQYPYHVTAKDLQKGPFPIPMKQMWDIFLKGLECTVKRFDINIHCFVLMNNHFHLLVDTPGANLFKAIEYLLEAINFQVKHASNNQIDCFKKDFSWSLVKHSNYYSFVYRYIYQNPVRAGVVKRVEDYSFHSLNLDKLSKNIATIIYKNKRSCLPYLNQGDKGEMYWLNQLFDDESSKVIERGLRGSEFAVNRFPSSIAS